MPWPILNHYEGDTLRQVAFPLGGIGTGTICLGGRAELRDFEIFNTPSKGSNPPFTFFALWCRHAGGPPVTRVLEGLLRPPYDGGFGVTASLAGLPRLRQVALDACYPFAAYTLSDPDLPVSVRLEAFNPLVPLDVESSGLPLAVLRYTLQNKTEQTVEASIAGSMYNFIGTDLFAYGGKSFGMRNQGPGKLMGGNVNEGRRTTLAGGTPLSGLLMRSEKVAARSPQDGTMALVALSGQTTWRRTWGPIHWNRHILSFWDDFSADGRLDDPADVPASPEGLGQIGSLASMMTIPARGSSSVTFLICWHFPHRTAAGCGWDTLDPNGGWVGNYYTNRFADAWDVAVRTVPELPGLEAESLRFAEDFVQSDLPQPVKEAALNNASTLRSTTCFRTADGNFFGFEGCHNDGGCCFGSCTHVWNYEQTTAFLFPDLARRMRRLELLEGTQPMGVNSFRLRLPLGSGPWNRAAADGQMGVVMKCYREWQMGDDRLLADCWPSIRALLSYCWLPGGWDSNQDGVMEGVQHNTYDVEFYGPNPLCSVWYLGALRAGEEMGRAVGDEDFARRCRKLFDRGSAWIDANLFNGEYYVQHIEPPADLDATRPELRAGMGDTTIADPDFQVGNGCLADQLVGQYMAHVAGLGHLLRPDHVRIALHSLMRYNFRTDLYNHWNNMRTYVLNDEPALMVCSWPGGDRPVRPVPYFSEAWTGLEYQAAAHMMFEGMVDDGVTVASAVRARYDGYRRNPWDEPECGHHYARAMASWALLLAMSGFHYSAVMQEISLRPARAGGRFRCIWTTPSGWGVVEQTDNGGRRMLKWRVTAGQLVLRRVGCDAGNVVKAVGARLDEQAIAASWTQTGRSVTVSLAIPATMAAGTMLEIVLEE
jgi:non-lysosomal glucosylceramidase